MNINYLIKMIKKDCKILLVCTASLTTTYYIYLLKNYLTKHKLDIEIDVVNYHELEIVQNKYDYIFVTSQIFDYHNLYERYGNKVKQIKSDDFISGNINAILTNI